MSREAPLNPGRRILRKPTYALATPLAAVLLSTPPWIPDRTAEILRRRLAASPGSESLAAIAATLGLTRERVRQVFDKGLSDHEARVGFRPVLARRIAALAARRHLSLDRVLQEPWTRGLCPTGVRLLVERFSGLSTVDAGLAGTVFLPIPTPGWTKAVRRLREVAAEADPDAPASTAVAAAVADLPEEFRAQVSSCLMEAHPAHDVLGLRQRLCPLPVFLAGLFPAGDRPAAAFELLARQHRASPDRLDEARLNAMLLGNAVPVGAGRFVMRDPGRDGEGADAIRGACLAVMRASPSRYLWTTADLARLVVVRLGGAPGDTMIAAVGAALGPETAIARYRPGIWTLAGARAPGRNRDEVAVSVLQEAGGPLPHDVLKARVHALWGIRKDDPFKPAGRLVRVAPGTWGLADRDLDVGPRAGDALAARALALMAEGPTQAEDVVASLAAEGMADLPAAPLAEAFLLARHGISTGPGRALRPPADATAPRPGTLSASLLDALAAAGDAGIREADLVAVERAHRAARGLPPPASPTTMIRKLLKERAVPHPRVKDLWVLGNPATPHPPRRGVRGAGGGRSGLPAGKRNPAPYPSRNERGRGRTDAR